MTSSPGIAAAAVALFLSAVPSTSSAQAISVNLGGPSTSPSDVGRGAPLADAAEKTDRARVRTLLAQRADVNAAQADGMTALHWAIYHGDREMAGQLLARRRQREGGQPVRRDAALARLHQRQRCAGRDVVESRSRSEPSTTWRRDSADDRGADRRARVRKSAPVPWRERRCQRRVARSNRPDVGRR